jgi:hypothetical protein
MIGLNGLSVNSTFVDLFRFSDTLQGYFEGLRAGVIYLPAEMHWYLAVFSIIVFVFPNSCQMGGLLKNTSEGIFQKYRCFQPTLFWAVLTGTFFSLALYRLLKVAPTEFLYFNF